MNHSKERFQDIIGVIRSQKSKKDVQYKGQTKTNKRKYISNISVISWRGIISKGLFARGRGFYCYSIKCGILWTFSFYHGPLRVYLNFCFVSMASLCYACTCIPTLVPRLVCIWFIWHRLIIRITFKPVINLTQIINISTIYIQIH
jgi:hypothetical protein